MHNLLAALILSLGENETWQNFFLLLQNETFMFIPNIQSRLIPRNTCMHQVICNQHIKYWKNSHACLLIKPQLQDDDPGNPDLRFSKLSFFQKWSFLKMFLAVEEFLTTCLQFFFYIKFKKKSVLEWKQLERKGMSSKTYIEGLHYNRKCTS